MKRIVLVPRLYGTAEDDWYPWLAEQLPTPIEVARLRPTPGEPSIEACLAELAVVAPADAAADTLFVGHSVGCLALLHHIAGFPAGTRIGGLVAVAGWFELDGEWPSIQQWLDTPVATERVRAAAPWIRVLLSDDDPYTADHVRNRALWVERLGADVQSVPGAKHFNAATQPEVRASIDAHRRP